MNCTEVHALMHNVMDGQSSDVARRHLNDHLEICSSCAMKWKQWQALMAGFETLSNDSRDVTVRPLRTISAPTWKHHVAWGSAIAATIMFAAWSFQTDSGVEVVSTGIDIATTTETQATPFEFDLGQTTKQEYIAVHETTRTPRVHVVWLYPIEKPKQMNKPSSGAPNVSAQPLASVGDQHETNNDRT